MNAQDMANIERGIQLLCLKLMPLAMGIQEMARQLNQWATENPERVEGIMSLLRDGLPTAPPKPWVFNNAAPTIPSYPPVHRRIGFRI